MRGVLLAFLIAVLAFLAGCLVPSDPKKQAEEIGSVAAEGALLAHDAAEGDTTGVFTRVHAEALRKNLAKLEPKVQEQQLATLLRDVDEALGRLEKDPGDRGGAAAVERRLDEAARQAEELAG